MENRRRIIASVSDEELCKIMSSNDLVKKFLIFGGVVDFLYESVAFFRFDWPMFYVSLSEFTPEMNGPVPAFEDFVIANMGQEIWFGDYKVSAPDLVESYAWQTPEGLVMSDHLRLADMLSNPKGDDKADITEDDFLWARSEAERVGRIPKKEA